MVKLIPKINEKIWKVLKELKLSPKETPQDFIKRTQGRKYRYSTVCENKKGEKFIFYARLHDSKAEKERVKTEAKIAEVLKERKFDFFPKYFAAKIEKDFEWIVREYFKESPLESKKEIEKLARPLKEKEILEICKTLFKIQKIKLSVFPFLKARELKNFFELPKEIEKWKVLTKKEREKVKELIKNNKEILKTENRYFCHGDFQIGNLIFEKGKLKVIDLDSAMISNFAYDICFLWSRLWRERVRKKILEKFFSLLPAKRKEIFKTLFCIDALFLGFHSFAARPREYSIKMKKKRKKFYLKMMKAALKGFDELKKI